MKHVLILALIALTFSTASAQIRRDGFRQLTPEEQHHFDSIIQDRERASYYIKKAANVELAMPLVAIAGGVGSYYLIKYEDNVPVVGRVMAVGTGIAVVAMWIVQNRYRYKAGKLLEHIRVEQNGISIRL
jgi:hypothetical protein